LNLKFHVIRHPILRRYLSVSILTIAGFAVLPLATSQAQSVLPAFDLPPVLPQSIRTQPLLPPVVRPQTIAPHLPPTAIPEAVPLTQMAALRGVRPLVSRPPAGSICPYQLESQINQILQRDVFRSTRWAIQIDSIDYPGALYSYNGNTFLIPASNVKLLTTAAALQSVSDSLDGPWKSFGAEIETINRYSDNEYANYMLKRIGGVSGAQTSLARLGILANSYRQVDGSGLSRQNLAAPVTLVSLLKSMRSSPNYAQFYASLPTGGVSGTLQNRFVNTGVQGRVHAKTGTLTGVRALSGYLEHPIYGTIVFSILGNQSSGGDALRKGIDDIVVKVGQIYPCS
jgi:serine-type D-Ala-D-Ala carboxypeptidase/endopeptidase (penicillin-binding protein 4)